MGTILVSVIKNLVEVMVFVFIAWSGILCGKKMGMNKKAKQGQDNK